MVSSSCIRRYGSAIFARRDAGNPERAAPVLSGKEPARVPLPCDLFRLTGKRPAEKDRAVSAGSAHAYFLDGNARCVDPKGLKRLGLDLSAFVSLVQWTRLRRAEAWLALPAPTYEILLS